MKVKFDEDFDYTPSGDPRVQIAYKAGWKGAVKRECGAAAVAAGKASETRRDPLAGSRSNAVKTSAET